MASHVSSPYSSYRKKEKKKRKERKGRIIYALNDYASKSAFEIGERKNSRP
jgi:hypothetical protein